jgi:branched-chain amino acid transport system substrate-binding protein
MSKIAALAVALLAFLPSAHAADPYPIHVILPLTGSGAFLGLGERQSLQFAEKAVNDSGGIQGQSLQFVFHDDQSNPQVAVQLASEIVATKPAVLLGSSLVAMCRAIQPLMKDGPVDYCFSPGLHPDPGDYAFTASVSTLDLADALVRYFRLKGWKRLALMFSTDASGQDAEDGFKQVLALPENKDMQLVSAAHFTIGDVSVAAQISSIKSANPDCFVAWSTGTPIATIFRAMLQAGLDVPFGTTDGNMTFAQMEQYASFLPKQLLIPAGLFIARDASLLPPEVAKAHQEFYKIFDAAGVKPDEPAELAWEPAMILVHALRTLGPKATAVQVRDFLAKLKGYAGIDGIYDFPRQPQRGLDVTNAVVTQWNNGKKSFDVVSKPTGVPLP